MIRKVNILKYIFVSNSKGRHIMNKFTLLLSFCALGFLTAMGSINPDNAAVWLSSQTQIMDILRLSVMGVLLILIFTNPPRKIPLRIIIGIAAVGLIGVASYGTYNNLMQAFDGIALLAAGTSALVATLEVKIIQEKKTRKETVRFKYLAQTQ